ncbi:helix-turn-helix transcriptional regulator [Kutzneria buriramensis]|uniref:Helix-turn-helix protein n=1 Tax=Kutzneria buriramensis TaxID=1045776 RepID=A0A3E0H1Z2_9PSEU|nr:helix-turn-helix transcriptional regulator [Kutzneria buriramensis]REH37054.1 helix-turn-helix protein [Kutzneria buriramensis]
MPPRAKTPLSEQRKLRRVLRQAREGKGMTQKDVTDALDWSPSKLIRIENGAVGISVTDLKALLLHYGVTDTVRVDELVQMLRFSKQSAWWQKYRDLGDSTWLAWLGIEWSAIRICQFQNLVVPGLLQSPGYIRALMALGSPAPETKERFIDLRLQRQKLIELDDGPEMSFVLDEVTLHRVIGDVATTREQLRHLREVVATRPKVSVRVLPFDGGVHKGMESSFSIYELSDEPNDYALQMDGAVKDRLLVDPSDETNEYVHVFAELEKVALPAGETVKIIDRRLAELEDKT